MRHIEPTEIVEIQEENQPIQQAAKMVLLRGRSVNIGYDTDGHMHLRRRARQIRHEFGRGVQWAAMKKDAPVSILPRRWKWPWWWI